MMTDLRYSDDLDSQKPMESLKLGNGSQNGDDEGKREDASAGSGGSEEEWEDRADFDDSFEEGGSEDRKSGR